MTKEFAEKTFEVLRERVSSAFKEITEKLRVEINEAELESCVNLATGKVYENLIQEVKAQLYDKFDGLKEKLANI